MGDYGWYGIIRDHNGILEKNVDNPLNELFYIGVARISRIGRRDPYPSGHTVIHRTQEVIDKTEFYKSW